MGVYLFSVHTTCERDINSVSGSVSGSDFESGRKPRTNFTFATVYLMRKGFG